MSKSMGDVLIEDSEVSIHARKLVIDRGTKIEDSHILFMPE